MYTAFTDKIYTLEEYIQLEWNSENRHEFINGQLYEMSGESDLNNKISLKIAFLFMQKLDSKFSIFAHDVKVGIPERGKYYYPDVFVTQEPRTDTNRYIKYQPVIIIEVVSPSTHQMDYVDKYLNYSTIPSLEYYLLVEPISHLITMYVRTNPGWEVEKFSMLADMVKLRKYGIEFTLQDIYG